MFTPQTIQSFRFCRYRYDAARATAYLDYALDSDQQSWHFTETLHFPDAPKQLSSAQQLAVEQLLSRLHLVAGISYYKAAMPQHIILENTAINADTAHFLNTLYRQGLGEFAYRNQLNLVDIKFPVSDDTAVTIIDYDLPKQTIVPLGGGKDSLVSIALLDQAKHDFRVFSVGNPRIINEVAQHIGKPHLQVKRQLDPHLFELNQQGAYNGHVPITGIIAYIIAISAVLYGFDTVIMSNERSANSGNLNYQGEEINHQYSKSLAFERDLQQQFAQQLPNFRYFSLLRPLSELAIAQLFAQHCQTYYPVFSSCNHNFKLHHAQQHTGRWCLNCPKCRFVFLALASFIPKTELLTIFGHNLLNDPKQQAGFDALIAYQAHKPFECVGEMQESVAAFIRLSQQPEWQSDYLVSRFKHVIEPQLRQQVPDLSDWYEQALLASDQHQIPSDFLEYLTVN